MSKYISIIIPCYGLNEYLNSEQFKYNLTWKLGAPIHITLVYNLEPKIYFKNEKKIKKLLKTLLDIINKCIYEIIKLKRLNKHIYFEIDKKELFIKSQEIFFKNLELSDKDEIFKKFHKDYRPHITVATSNNKDFGKLYKKLNDKYKKILPKKFKINKMWILLIDRKKKHDTKLLDVIL